MTTEKEDACRAAYEEWFKKNRLGYASDEWQSRPGIDFRAIWAACRSYCEKSLEVSDVFVAMAYQREIEDLKARVKPLVEALRAVVRADPLSGLIAREALAKFEESGK